MALSSAGGLPIPSLPPSGAMTDVFAAAVLDSLPGAKYTAALRYAELSLRSPLPRAPTLKRARYAFPDGFRVGLRFPTSAIVSKRGALRFDDAMEEAFGWSLAAVDALAATVALISTPVDVTPGGRDRELFREYVRRLPTVEGRSYVWEPSGLWEQDDAVRFAADLGVVLASDPLETPLPTASLAYCRLIALGGRTRFSEVMLGRVVEQIAASGAETAYVAIQSDRSFEQACSLQRLSGEHTIVDSATK